MVREILTGLDDVAFCQLHAGDVVRHKLVGRIVEAYGRYEAVAGASQHGGSERRRPRR